MNPRPPMIPQILPREAHARVAEGGPATPLIVDVRNPDEFARVRVPGSVLIPLPVFVQRYNELPADRPLLVLCQSGSRSGSATAFLLRSGYPEVANIVGGIVAWYHAGLPVASGAPEPGEGELPG
jgi:rhodanese-related sulfurtransferase